MESGSLLRNPGNLRPFKGESLGWQRARRSGDECGYQKEGAKRIGKNVCEGGEGGVFINDYPQLSDIRVWVSGVDFLISISFAFPLPPFQTADVAACRIGFLLHASFAG